MLLQFRSSKIRYWQGISKNMVCFQWRAAYINIHTNSPVASHIITDAETHSRRGTMTSYVYLPYKTRKVGKKTGYKIHDSTTVCDNVWSPNQYHAGHHPLCERTFWIGLELSLPGTSYQTDHLHDLVQVFFCQTLTCVPISTSTYPLSGSQKRRDFCEGNSYSC
jgi:hypothetical protein